jgi:hypothetical protein
MAPHPLTEVDPAALGISYLSGHPDVVAALAAYGGTAGRVAGVNRPPFPRITVSDPPSGFGRLVWLVSPALQIEVIGDLDGTPGKAALYKLAMTAVGALVQWPEQTFGPDDAVITQVVAQMPGWMPLPTGQPRYVSTATVWMHPPVHR